MNGFHASALEEEDSKAIGELCNVWVGGWVYVCVCGGRAPEAAS